LTNFARAVALQAGQHVELVVVPEEGLAEVKAKGVTGKFPLLETPEGTLNESVAIAKFLASGSATLLGSSNVEKAQVDQWCYWMISKVLPSIAPAVYSIFGHRELTQAEFNDASKAAKDFVRDVDKALTGDYLVGSNLTVADFCVALLLAPAFQTLLDAGFRKAAPKATAWFERVVKLDSVVKTHGVIKAAAKSLKPLIKVEEKKVAPKPVVQAKPKDDEEKKKEEKNPLDALPESSFDLFNFKTFFVNHPDKSGAAVDELLKQFDRQGYAMWFLQYEKYKGEGEVMYKT
jgi:elongation factor 1-gamma